MSGSPRLGRGLDALFQGSPQKRDTWVAEGKSNLIQISRIMPDPEQPRKHFDGAELETLKQSIEIHGVLQPILVTRSHLDNSQFLIIAGERRWRAARAAGSKVSMMRLLLPEPETPVTATSRPVGIAASMPSRLASTALSTVTLTMVDSI